MKRGGRAGGRGLLVEELERRELLSAAVGAGRSSLPMAYNTLALALTGNGKHKAVPSSTSPQAGSFIPTQILHAYGMDQVTFGSVKGDGTGQTIAIVDAYHDPTALNDLQAFDAQFGIPDPPSFRQVAQDGSQNFPTTDPAGAGNPNGTWEIEESLDIEWAHAMAPGANILLVEASDNSFANLLQQAEAWVRTQPGVSVVSMSFGSGEFGTETTLDSLFTTPSGHIGETFVAATGDDGKPGGYPAYSPNVVAVGGTSLTLDGSGNYVSETGWSGSGGGISAVESQPSYQNGVVTQSTTRRTTPDVAMVADPDTGVAVYDSFDFPGSPWITVGGTSLATPLFAASIAVADQGRVLQGLGTLDGRNNTLPTLYSASAAQFHDITSGSNGNNQFAGPGYDLVTGRGSPMLNFIVPDLVGVTGSISGHTFEDFNGDGIDDGNDTPLAGVTVFLDSNNNGVLDSGVTQTFASGTVNLGIPDANSGGVTSTQTLSGLSGNVAHVTVTFTISHPRDSDLTGTLIGPDGTAITLFSGLSGTNFSGTTLDDQAATPITSSTSSSYSGTYQPSPGKLSSFIGKNPNGNWKLKIVDGRFRDTGSLTSWSITVTTSAEVSTVSGSDGSYSFTGLTPGTYTVREVVPQGFTESGTTSYMINVTGPVTAIDFANVPPAPSFPANFTASGPNEIFHLWVDGTTLEVGMSADEVNPVYRIDLSSAPALTFNLNQPGATLIVDFTNASPIPAGNILVDGGGLADSQVEIIGQSSAQQFTMTDTHVGPTGGGIVQYQNLGTLSFLSSTVFYSGSLSTLDVLNIGAGTVFNWS